MVKKQYKNTATAFRPSQTLLRLPGRKRLLECTLKTARVSPPGASTHSITQNSENVYMKNTQGNDKKAVFFFNYSEKLLHRPRKFVIIA